MLENPRRGRQARNFTTNVPKILVLKSSSEQIFSRKLPLGAPAYYSPYDFYLHNTNNMDGGQPIVNTVVDVSCMAVTGSLTIVVP